MKQSSSTTVLNRELPVSLFLIFLGFAWNDVINYSVPTPIGSSVMLVDILFFLSLAFAVQELSFFRNHKMILWLPVLFFSYILIGFWSAGMKAFSDCRQFYHFFFPFLGFKYAKNIASDRFSNFLFKVIFSLAIGSFLLFVVEMIIGHGFGLAIMSSEETDYGFLEDERGVRILGAPETFNLCVFLIYSYLFKGKLRLKYHLLFSIIFFIAVLFTQNRTPIISTCFGLAFMTLLYFKIRKGKAHFLFRNIILLSLGVFGIYLLDYYNIHPLFSSLRSALSIENDEIGTSSFRLLGALGALDIFFKNMIFGEGLGNGWHIDFGFAVLNIPPHNQYAAILAKVGLFGFGLFILWMSKYVSLIKEASRNTNDKQLIRFAIVIFASQIPYGFGFEFHPFFPFFFGMLLTRLIKKPNEENTYNYSNL